MPTKKTFNGSWLGMWKKGQKETSEGEDQERETPGRRSNRLGGTKVEGSYFGC